MEDAEYPREREIIPCCVHLRTKTQYYMQDEMEAGPGFIKITDAGTYWCGKSHHALGPDDDPARPRTCQPGRSCYEREHE